VKRIALACGLLTVLGACAGKVPLAQAEAQCAHEARYATAPRGHVTLGAGTGGARLGGEITVSSDFLLRRDPAQVFERCVIQRAGQQPSQPLYTRTDWKG